MASAYLRGEDPPPPVVALAAQSMVAAPVAAAQQVVAAASAVTAAPSWGYDAWWYASPPERYPYDARTQSDWQAASTQGDGDARASASAASSSSRPPPVEAAEADAALPPLRVDSSDEDSSEDSSREVYRNSPAIQAIRTSPPSKAKPMVAPSLRTALAAGKAQSSDPPPRRASLKNESMRAPRAASVGQKRGASPTAHRVHTPKTARGRPRSARPLSPVNQSLLPSSVVIYTSGSFGIDVKHKNYWPRVIQAFEAQHPDVAGTIDVFLDCQPFKDKRFTRHCGEHSGIIESVVQNKRELARIFEFVQSRLDARKGEELGIVCFCRQGRHRSVAVARILFAIFSSFVPLTLQPVHLSKHGWKHLCSTCRECDAKDYDERKKASIEVARTIWCN